MDKSEIGFTLQLSLEVLEGRKALSDQFGSAGAIAQLGGWLLANDDMQFKLRIESLL